jgi:outer membrane protein OmpA-like peptidoglycan-associated protein
MKSLSYKLARSWAQKALGVMLAGMTLASIANAEQGFTADVNYKVKGQIVSRNGDLVKIQQTDDSSIAEVKIDDNTRIERNKGKIVFRRHKGMDVTALVPGLTITVNGVGNASNQVEAKKITFSPDEFAVEVAQEQQILGNKTAAEQAQSTANQGVTAAGAAQSSADQAQSSANAAGSTAQAATTLGTMNAAAVQLVNKRVSDLDDYKTLAESVIFYPSGKYTLDDKAKADLDKLADLAQQTDGYMIEIAGYASQPGSKGFNQQLSENRAEAVAQYLRNQKNIPLRRILAPAGYGATHPDAPNNDPQGRALNRRVDVKLIVSKGIASGE